MKALHILYQSLPQISGSTIRSRDILMSQNEIGLNAFALTVPFLENSSQSEIDEIEGVKYYRTNSNKRSKNKITDEYKGVIKRLKKLFKIPKFIIQLHRLCKKENPDILHAHAMFFCGIAALIVGKIHKKPVFYEVRSLWMLPKDNNYKSLIHRLITKLLLKIEVFTMHLSKTVFVVNDNLKDKIIALGINDQKIVVIKNAVNTTLISKNLKKTDLNTGFKKNIVFGYIGSITPYEGIPFMIDTLNELSKTNINFKFYIYGSVKVPNELKIILNKIKEYNLENIVEYKGSVNPTEIFLAYQEIDIIVNPRLKNKITDTVTPLKPIEAMAYKKIFIGSDVGGIKDLLKDHKHGFLFKNENIISFVKVLKTVMDLPLETKNEEVSKAQKYVMREQSWLKNAMIYKKTYKAFITKKESV